MLVNMEYFFIFQARYETPEDDELRKFVQVHPHDKDKLILDVKAWINVMSSSNKILWRDVTLHSYFKGAFSEFAKIPSLI